MSTGAQMLTRIRLHLQETTASEWDNDSQLLPYLNDAYFEVCSELAMLLRSGWFKTENEFTVAASTETFDLTTLTYLAANSGTSFWRFANLWHVWNDRPLPVPPAQRGSEAELRHSQPVSAAVTPAAYMRREGGTPYLVLLPTASDTRTFRALYWYRPPEVTSASSLETPREYDALIGYLSAEKALMDEGQGDDRITAEVNRLRVRMIDHEHGSEGAEGAQGTPEVYSGLYWSS